MNVLSLPDVISGDCCCSKEASPVWVAGHSQHCMTGELFWLSSMHQGQAYRERLLQAHIAMIDFSVSEIKLLKDLKNGAMQRFFLVIHCLLCSSTVHPLYTAFYSLLPNQLLKFLPCSGDTQLPILDLLWHWGAMEQSFFILVWLRWGAAPLGLSETLTA